MGDRIFQSSWSVDPLEWLVNIGGEPEDPVTLEPPTRDAALQVSTFRKNNGDVTDEDIRSFALEANLLDGACVVACGSFAGLLATQLKETTWWRHWWLRSGNTLLYVTYNGDIAIQARDHLIANEILATLQVETR